MQWQERVVLLSTLFMRTKREENVQSLCTSPRCKGARHGSRWAQESCTGPGLSYSTWLLTIDNGFWKSRRCAFGSQKGRVI